MIFVYILLFIILLTQGITCMFICYMCNILDIEKKMKEFDEERGNNNDQQRKIR